MTRAERAQQLWSLLALAATSRQVLTYDMVARLTGVVRPSIGDFLRPIQQYCTENQLPPLTALVVSDQSGIPGEGFIAAADVPAAQMRVFQHKWLENNAPSAEQFEAAYRVLQIDGDVQTFVAADGSPAPCHGKPRRGPPQNNTLSL
jgi:Zn ribbon nucleic-acid-binding protein